MGQTHAMTAFMRGALSLKQIYDLLVEDFARSGKGNINPLTALYDSPPQGMGYRALALQGFINTYINSKAGRVRYSLDQTNTIYVTQIPNKKNVGNLALLIYAKQS